MLVGIDGGGTKTELIACAATGVVHAHVRGSGTNPNDIGRECAFERLRTQLTALLSAQEGLDTPLQAVFAGLSGGGATAHVAAFRTFLMQTLPHAAHWGNASDMVNALNCGVGAEDGMVLIAGTGSSLLVRAHGVQHQVGGWGYLLDDAGSGFVIGRQGFNAVLRAADGRGPQTDMTALFTQKLGAPAEQCIAKIYEGSKQYIASFTPLVFEAAEAGDEVALGIVRWTVQELLCMLRTGAAWIERPPYRIVQGGSIWQAPLVRRGVAAGLTSDYVMSQPVFPPVYGAVVEAATIAGVHCDAIFHANFGRTFETCPVLMV